MPLKRTICCAGLFAAACLTAGSVRTEAQPRAKAAVAPPAATISADNQRVPGLLQQILTAAHVSYTIDPALSESYATVKLKSVPLDAALAAIQRTCTRPFTYDKSNGIYRFVPTGASNLDWQRITVELRNTSIASGIATLMSQAHADFVLDPDVAANKRVMGTVSLIGVPFKVALESVVGAAADPVTYRVETVLPGPQVFHFVSVTHATERDKLASGKLRYTDASLQTDPELIGILLTDSFETARLASAIKQVMDEAHVRCEIDASVDDLPVSVNYTRVPFPDAIRLLLHASGQPIEYHFENDVLRFKRRGK